MKIFTQKTLVKKLLLLVAIIATGSLAHVTYAAPAVSAIEEWPVQDHSNHLSPTQYAGPRGPADASTIGYAIDGGAGPKDVSNDVFLRVLVSGRVKLDYNFSLKLGTSASLVGATEFPLTSGFINPDTTPKKIFVVTMSGLSPSTTYYYKVFDKKYNSSMGSVLSFTTTATPPPVVAGGNTTGGGSVGGGGSNGTTQGGVPGSSGGGGGLGAQAPIACGPADTASFSSEPEGGYCTNGDLKDASLVQTTTGWSWQCAKQTIATPQNCSATKNLSSPSGSTAGSLSSPGGSAGANLGGTSTGGPRAAGNTAAAGDKTVSDGLANNFLKNPFKSLDTFPKIIKAVVNNIVLPIAIPFIAVMIIYSGALFVIARKESNVYNLEKAKSTLKYTLIGAALMLGAFVIANALQSTLDSLTK